MEKVCQQYLKLKKIAKKAINLLKKLIKNIKIKHFRFSEKLFPSKQCGSITHNNYIQITNSICT